MLEWKPTTTAMGASSSSRAAQHCVPCLGVRPVVEPPSDLLRNETGRSAKDHINDFIVEKAKTLLLSTNEPVSGIAYTLGFNYPHYFSRLFKSRTGVTPRISAATDPASGIRVRHSLLRVHSGEKAGSFVPSKTKHYAMSKKTRFTGAAAGPPDSLPPPTLAARGHHVVGTMRSVAKKKDLARTAAGPGSTSWRWT